MSELTSLVFVSRSVIPQSREEIELGGIVRSSARRNHDRGVTGALVLADGHFAGVLEGPADAITHLRTRLELDPRHEAMRVLEHKEILEKGCARWDMVYHGPSSYVSKRIQRLVDAESSSATNELVQLLRCLLRA